jgi:large subunit ribosomal protein L6
VKKMERRVAKNGTEVTVNGLEVSVAGEKRNFSDPRYDIKIKDSGDEIIISGKDDRKSKAMIGTISAHIKNMITGVTKGFRYKVKINSTHFPMTAEVKDNYVIIKNFIGSRGIRKAKILEGVNVDVQKTEITLEGANKEKVAQTAANIEAATRLPRKDRRIFGDGCFVAEKGVC